MNLEDNQSLVLLVIGVLLLMCWQNFFGKKMVAPPETLAPGPQREEEEEMPMMGEEMEFASGNGNAMVAQQPQSNGNPEEGTTRAYGDFDGPTGPVYFKPHGAMGDAASSPNGVMNQVASGCHPIDKCNRFYCEGCGQCNPGGDSTDTDDIRRDYNGMITQLRAKRNNEYPFYQMS